MKKRAYAANVRERVLNGFINNPNGDWASNNSQVTDKCKNFSFAGVQGKAGRRTRRAHKVAADG